MELATVQAQQREIKITRWFGQFSKRILSFVKARVSDVEEAEDIAQDVWLQLNRQADIDSIEQVGNWLFTTARNRVTDYYRKKKTLRLGDMGGSNAEDSNSEDIGDGLMFDSWVYQNLPDNIIENKQFWQELEGVLNQMPKEQSEIFIAHELEGVSFKELSEQTGVSVNTLLGRKRYAVEKLRRHFENYID